MSEHKQHNCEYCDTFGGEKTGKHQVRMPLHGEVVRIDWCIHTIVAALNATGIWTIASCCGHKQMPGRVDLADGRVLVILDKTYPDPDKLDWTSAQQ